MGEVPLSHGVTAVSGNASPEGRQRRHAVRGISSDEGMALLAGIHLGSRRLTLMMFDRREAVDAQGVMVGWGVATSWTRLSRPPTRTLGCAVT